MTSSNKHTHKNKRQFSPAWQTHKQKNKTTALNETLERYMDGNDIRLCVLAIASPDTAKETSVNLTILLFINRDPKTYYLLKCFLSSHYTS